MGIADIPGNAGRDSLAPGYVNMEGGGGRQVHIQRFTPRQITTAITPGPGNNTASGLCLEPFIKLRLIYLRSFNVHVCQIVSVEY